MNKDTCKDKTKVSIKVDHELIGKLFSAGFTILGIGVPVMAGALVALRSTDISVEIASGLRRLVWILLPAVVICTVQSLLCLGTITGLFNKPRLAIYMTCVLLVYMMCSIIAWALITIT